MAWSSSLLCRHMDSRESVYCAHLIVLNSKKGLKPNSSKREIKFMDEAL